MKRWQYIVLIALLLVALFVYLHRRDLGLAGARVEDAESSRGASGDGEARPARMEWRQVDRTPDGFKVDMPAEVRETQVSAYNQSGGAEQVAMIYANPTGETTFAVSWADDPPVARGVERTPERILDQARDNALQRTQTVKVEESNPNSDGSAVREFSSRNSGGGVMNTRLILSGRRLYMLIATFPSAQARREQDVTRFFNSFSLTSANRIPESLPGVIHSAH